MENVKMKVDVFNLKGEKTDSIELPEEIFGAKVNVDLMHQAYQRQMLMPVWEPTTPSAAAKSVAVAQAWKQRYRSRSTRQHDQCPVCGRWSHPHPPKPRDYSQAMPPARCAVPHCARL